MLEVLGLIFLGLIIVVCLVVSGIAFNDWMERRQGLQTARAVFWITLLIGVAVLVWFSYLSSGAKVWL